MVQVLTKLKSMMLLLLMMVSHNGLGSNQVKVNDASITHDGCSPFEPSTLGVISCSLYNF